MNISIIKEELEKKYNIIIFEELPSTNDYIKDNIGSLPNRTIVAALSQTSGKGTKNRSFYSPKNSGIYFSMLFKEQNSVKTNLLFTTAAACAVSKGIQDTFGKKTKIKWVNDIYYKNKKVCGILSESTVCNEKNSYVIVGIGINLVKPAVIPDEIKPVFGYISKKCDEQKIAMLLMSIADYMCDYADNLKAKPHYDYYIKHSLLNGKKVEITENNRTYDAKAIKPDTDFSLIVKTDRQIKRINSNDVKIKKR